MRYPLVDGECRHIDGDSAAAMRYTEARKSDVARMLLEGIDEDAVDFRDTYDGESEEPVILPAAFPNLLANGAQGIAVGMATSIPPHNIIELADAILHLIKRPNASDETIHGFVPGLISTGGVLIHSPETMAEAYRTGRGLSVYVLIGRWKRKRRYGRSSGPPFLIRCRNQLNKKMAEMMGQETACSCRYTG